MRTVFSEDARAALIEISLHIGKDSKRHARSFTRELRACAVSIANAPRAYPVVEAFADAGLRRRAYKSYLIFYRVEIGRVLIVQIMHGARDYEALLKPSD